MELLQQGGGTQLWNLPWSPPKCQPQGTEENSGKSWKPQDTGICFRDAEAFTYALKLAPLDGILAAGSGLGLGPT